MLGPPDQRSTGHHALLVADRAHGGALLLQTPVGVLALEADTTERRPDEVHLLAGGVELLAGKLTQEVGTQARLRV